MQPRDEEVAADSCRVAAPPHEHSVSVAEVVKGVPLLRGRLLALLAVLVTSFDTPTYRVLRLSLPQDSPSFGFAVALWGGWIGGVGCLALCLHTDGSWAALVEHIRELGAKHIALGTSLLGSSILVFTLALAQTTAANVLVLLALSPLVTALLGRAVLGPPPLSAHTWAACVAGLVATVLVFYGSLDLGPSKLLGTGLAALYPVLYSAFTVQCAAVPTVCFSPIRIFAGPLVSIASAIALVAPGGAGLAAATPSSPLDVFLLLAYGLLSSLATVLLARAVRTCPAAELSLLGMLETAISPVLVYAIVREQPGTLAVVAGGLTLAVLVAHTIFDAWLAKRESAAAAAMTPQCGAGSAAPHADEGSLSRGRRHARPLGPSFAAALLMERMGAGAPSFRNFHLMSGDGEAAVERAAALAALRAKGISSRGTISLHPRKTEWFDDVTALRRARAHASMTEPRGGAPWELSAVGGAASRHESSSDANDEGRSGGGHHGGHKKLAIAARRASQADATDTA